MTPKLKPSTVKPTVVTTNATFAPIQCGRSNVVETDYDGVQFHQGVYASIGGVYEKKLMQFSGDGSRLIKYDMDSKSFWLIIDFQLRYRSGSATQIAKWTHFCYVSTQSGQKAIYGTPADRWTC